MTMTASRFSLCLFSVVRDGAESGWRRFAALAFACVTCSDLSAQIFAYEFSATITSVANELLSEFSVGEDVTGTVTFDQMERVGNLYTGHDFSATIGDDYSLSSTGAHLRVVDSVGGERDVVILDVIDERDGLLGPSVNGHAPEYFTINLLYDDTVLPDGRLQPDFALPVILDRSGLRFDQDDALVVRYAINRFRVVPEPSSVLLSFLGLSALAPARRKLRVSLSSTK